MATTPCDWEFTSSICCADWDSYDPALQEQAARWATFIMWAATGRQFDACELTVYPCGRDGWDGGAGAWGYWWNDGVFVPYIWQGQWYNAICCGGIGCYSCRPRCGALLPGPVLSVATVIVDGATIDPSEYRVYDQQWLTRLGNECWPACQDYNNENLKFAVTYTRGTAVPAIVLDQAGVLACEYAKACLGLECQLPSRVVNIARQGVTVSLQSIDEVLENGFTGITSVDQVIAKINPGRLKGRTRLYSPDIPVARMIT